MKLKKVVINKYKAIQNVELNLNYNINPIIGVNESGKTTVLQALLALDKYRDRFNKGIHLDYQNKYQNIDTLGCTIIATINLTKLEIEELIKALNLKTDSNSYESVKSITDKTDLEFSRELDNNFKFNINIDNLSVTEKNRAINFIQKKFPAILYFDDFTDRIPTNIVFPEDYLESGKLSKGKRRDWQEIIEEIFNRTELEGLNSAHSALQEYMEINDDDRKGNILDDITDVLNDEIIEEWKKIKKRGNNYLGDDSEKLKLSLSNPQSNTFIFKVIDKSASDKRRRFNIVDRSKGFQWFFNYMIKLKFNPRYNQTQENLLFLLDEPGSYLHSSAQSELLIELKRISKKNTIIYCTHSQYLLNPKSVKLGSIKIADKPKSEINLIPFGDFKSKNDKGALTPIYQALNLNFARDFIGDSLLFEGITDYYLFSMLQKNWINCLNEKELIAGAGSGNATILISLAISFCNDFRIVFDNDRGTEAIGKYEEIFGDALKSKIIIYGEKKAKFTLEKHFSKLDQDKLNKITGAKKFKKSIQLLYFDFNEEQDNYLNTLSLGTKKNLKDTLNLLDFK